MPMYSQFDIFFLIAVLDLIAVLNLRDTRFIQFHVYYI